MQLQVHSLQSELHGSTELLLINAGSDVWKCPTSYVISAALEVAVMVHIPIARKDSFMYFYRYVTTPMMAPENKFRMLAVPRNNLLGINRNSHVSREVSEEYFRRCESVGNGPRFCPSEPIQLTETANTCLTALYGNEMAIVAETCPVLHLNQSQPYVVALSPRHFSVYLPGRTQLELLVRKTFWGV